MNIRYEKIKNKKVLFLSPSFFDYEKKIAKKLDDMGAQVDYYNERSVDAVWNKALLKVVPNLFYHKSKIYYDDILDHNLNKNYDYVFIIKCDMTPKKTLIKMRQLYPKAKFCLYLWDSVKNIPNIASKFKYFDVIYSFDLKDCSRYKGLKFRPLFFSDDFCKEASLKNTYKNDICFCGTIHSDRYSIIQKINKFCQKNNLVFYKFCYLQSHFIYYFYWLRKKEFRYSSRGEFFFVKKTGKEISSIIDESRVVLDIEHPKQSGLTMRTIEMLGMNKKIITTNSTIKQYDFYNPNNIYVIDRDSIVINKYFLLSPYEPVQPEIYEKYSLEQWLLDILI